MVPKVEGPWDIHYVDRLLAQLEARAGLERPILVHAILETAQGVANVEEIANASPRMQGISLGPADLAASRRMKTTRVGGGHPGYRVLADPDGEAPRPSYQQDLWHYTIGRMVDACAAAGIFPFYGPFGDIKDVEGCEAQFRAAYLMGCVGGRVVDVPGPSTFGSIITSSRDRRSLRPMSPVVQDPGRLERVHPRPQRVSRARSHAPRDQPGPRGLLAIGRDRVLEIAQQDVRRSGHIRQPGEHLLARGVEEMDHPHRRHGDLEDGSGAPIASGAKWERGLRIPGIMALYDPR